MQAVHSVFSAWRNLRVQSMFFYCKGVRHMNERRSDRFASVWDAIEDTTATAENKKPRSALMI